MEKIIFILINIVIVLFFPLFFLGIINKTKAVIGGRKGASVFQPFYDFMKLMRKGEVISNTTSFIFSLAPIMILSSLLFAYIFIPISGNSIMNFEGDFVLFAYLLGFSKFFMVISALDTGSSFEGMGASREVTFTSILEPGFFIIMGSVAFISGLKSFNDIHNLLLIPGHLILLIITLVVIALFIMMIVEGCRVPADDPNTHLELTMIHEVMVLDNSGPDFGFILYSSGLKMFLISSIIALFITPFGYNLYVGYLMYIAIVIASAIVIGIIESIMARVRMSHVLEFVLIMVSISFLILSSVVVQFVKGA